jgi:KaiC/GvpD/RAD55 family RecA-like ATPase
LQGHQQELRIPPEIMEFFINEGGHSLIVRGEAGTGKTTFALQTIEELSAVTRSFYLSTRVSDASLYLQFPWLAERIGSPVEEGKERRREALDDLKGVGRAMADEPVRKIMVTIGRNMSEMDAIYDVIEEALPEKSLLVVDSIDALAEKYEMLPSKLINTIQKDVVEGYGANVIFVTESQEDRVDYLGDGVVRFNSEEHQRRRVREMEILKLRGCMIGQPKYLFTLRGGKIRSFGYRWGNNGEDLSWSPKGDQGEMVSTGMMDIDRLLGGGLDKGSINLIEVGQGVPPQISAALENSLIANFVAMNRGVVSVPMRKESGKNLRHRVTRAVGDEGFDHLVRVAEKADQIDPMEGRYVMPLEGDDALNDFNWQKLVFNLHDAYRPYLAIMGMDTMEAIYGKNVMDRMMNYLASIKRNKAIFVGFTTPSTNSNKRLADLATNHLRIERIGGTPVLYGEEPFTECNAITYEEKEEWGDLRLTPIL